MTGKELIILWKNLFEKDPPSTNRGYLIKRLAYRIQEIAYGVDTHDVEERLDKLAKTKRCTVPSVSVAVTVAWRSTFVVRVRLMFWPDPLWLSWLFVVVTFTKSRPVFTETDPPWMVPPMFRMSC
jgi:hypothetical protein